MKISVVGAGYVGIVTGIGFAEIGHEVIFVDINKEKVDLINSGKPPLYEKGLEELMRKNKKKYRATLDFGEAVNHSEITFVCVSTPSKDDGSIDLSYVKSAAQEIGKALSSKENFHVVVVKSTVIPGTTEEVVKPIISTS